ncbi:MAG: cell division protein FtsA [Candidatus Omnitrophica bacterium]|nr:cell division protein FtsA [Candidatus Omnitrophota bacterium]
MKKPQLIASLALGDKIFTLAAGFIHEQNRLIVRALESVPSQGIERGLITDPIECSDTIARLVRETEKKLSARILRVYTAIQGSTLTADNASAAIPIPDPTVGISRRDVEKVVNACKTLSLDYDRQIIHTFTRGFTLDGQAGIKDPVGLSGNKLGVELHLVTAQNLAVHNLLKVVNRAGVEVEQFVLPSVAAGEAVLTDLDRDLGVTLIHIGESQTETLLYTDGAVKESVLLPWGIEQLTDSMSRSLKLPKSNAEQIFEQVKTIEKQPEWAATPFTVQAGTLARTVPQEQVSHLLSEKSNEFLEKIRRKLEEIPYFRESAAGVVMVGELARLEGFLEICEQALNMPVRLGIPRGIEVDSDLELKPAYTVVMGLLAHNARRIAASRRALAGPLWRRFLEKSKQVFEEYF